MIDVREVGFELVRFTFTAPGRLEVVGRWSGLEGRRLGRPVLTIEAGDLRKRLTALPGGQFTPSSTGEWRAAFAYDGDPEAVTGAELEVGRRLVAELPRPRRRRAEPATAEPAPPREAERELNAQVERLTAELEPLRAEHERLAAEQAELYDRVRAAELGREELAAEVERLTNALSVREAELAAAREEAAAAGEAVERARENAEQQLAAERAKATDVRDSLATAREEAQKAIAAEAEETERLRTELQATREEMERMLNAERDETARLRAELAARPAYPNGDEGIEADDAAKRMYERIARELDHERAAARQLRRELDSIQAETAQNRREASTAAATSGGDAVTEPDGPTAATPAGRLAARRTEVARAAAQHRADAARAAAAHRTPEAQRSPVNLWLVRGTAIVLVAALLVALVLIVSAVA
jgi:hypothetical protein